MPTRGGGAIPLFPRGANALLLSPLFVGAVAGGHRGAEYALSESNKTFRALEFGQTQCGADGEGVFGFHDGSATGGLRDG